MAQNRLFTVVTLRSTIRIDHMIALLTLKVWPSPECLAILWPVQLSVWSLSRSITLQSLVTVAV